MRTWAPFIGALTVAVALAVVFGGPSGPAVNPDPNHTHADFRVIIDGTEIGFEDDVFMSGAYQEGERTQEAALHKFLHLHDGNGHVIHRHKPGLVLQEFFDSIRVGFTANCIVYQAPVERDMVCSDNPWRMVVNGQERPFSLDYDFADLDQILLSTAATDDLLAAEWEEMTDDACLYSRTCPDRGEPPTENCIADPEVPCVQPE